jgi:3-dehydroquinate dehydratase-2
MVAVSGTILLLSGPNLDLLGEREPGIYGTSTLKDLVGAARAAASVGGFELRHEQSSYEGDLVRAVHSARGTTDAIIVNPGALTHYGWSLHDALAAYEGPVVELHLSNPSRREAWRSTSVIAPVATGTISGFGATGYRLAVEAVVAELKRRRTPSN